MPRATVITVSDSCSRGEREDVSGPEACRLLREAGFDVETPRVVPDERSAIAAALREAAASSTLVVTTGGTGLAARDVTPEATLDVIDRAVPGIPEAIRAGSLKITPKAMLSRAAAGIRKKTLIINLSGSERAVREQLAVVLPVLGHAVETLRGEGGDCGRR